MVLHRNTDIAPGSELQEILSPAQHDVETPTLGVSAPVGCLPASEFQGHRYVLRRTTDFLRKLSHQAKTLFLRTFTSFFIAT